jgi:hypothetical protein
MSAYLPIDIIDIDDNIDKLEMTHLLFDGSCGYDMRVPDEKVLDMLSKEILTLWISRQQLTGSFVATNLQLLTTDKRTEYQRYYFEINKEMASFFEKIVAKYHATKPDKNFNIIPSNCIKGKPSINVNIDTDFTHLYYNDNERDKTNLHNLMSSRLASYLTYDIHFSISFKNNHRSNYIPTFNTYGIRLNINKSIVEQEATKLSKRQMRLYSKLIFSKCNLLLPDEILDHIASFLVHHNSNKISETINTQILNII